MVNTLCRVSMAGIFVLLQIPLKQVVETLAYLGGKLNAALDILSQGPRPWYRGPRSVHYVSAARR